MKNLCIEVVILKLTISNDLLSAYPIVRVPMQEGNIVQDLKEAQMVGMQTEVTGSLCWICGCRPKD
jgi:hypothetical protein